MRRKVGDGYHRRPSRRNGGTRRCHHIGAGRTGKDFSRTPNTTAHPEPTIQTTTQCATSVAPPPTSSHYEDHHEAEKTGEKRHATRTIAPMPSGREPTPPPSCEKSSLWHCRGSRPDTAVGHTRPPLARPGPKRTLEAPPVVLQQAGIGAASPRHATPLPCIPGLTPPTSPAAGPPRPRWAL